MVNSVCEEAKQCAIEAGAEPGTVKIIELNNLPMQYVQMRASRIIAKAAGSLSKNSFTAYLSDQKEELLDTWVRPHKETANAQKNPKDFIVSPSARIDVRSYRPNVEKSGIWWVSAVDLEFLATGCSILACGGGGPGYMCYMAARAALQAGHKLSIVDINILPDDEYVMGSISYG